MNFSALGLVEIVYRCVFDIGMCMIHRSGSVEYLLVVERY